MEHVKEHVKLGLIKLKNDFWLRETLARNANSTIVAVVNCQSQSNNHCILLRRRTIEYDHLRYKAHKQPILSWTTKSR